jgi:hypothetical protein
MNATSAEGVGAVSGLEQMVADYLRGHADFFERHEDVLAEIELLHACGRAVSLIEYQVVVLRDQNRLLRRRFQGLVETARENEEISERVHRLILKLVGCRGLTEILAALYSGLRESFGADRAAVRLFARPAAQEDSSLPEFLGEDDRARRLLAPVLGVTSPLCGRVPDDQLAVLFAGDREAIRSSALLPLGAGRRLGVLAIGSSEETRYQPGMATTFLRQLADVAGEILRPHVLAPEPPAA